MVKKLNLLSGVGLIVLAHANTAYAQDTMSADSDVQARNSNTIIVTARKVAETVQDIPIAITAFSSEELRDRSIRDLQDIALQTPGFIYEDYSNGGYGTPTIRGATQFNITSLEQNVSVFLDGIYMPRQYSFNVGTANLERVEVVKGPQSALYGANAFAGAVNFITTSRSLTEFKAHVELGASEDKGFDISGKINAPIIAGRLSVRAAGSRSKYGGAIPNNHPNANLGLHPGTNGNFGGYNNDAYMFGVTAKPFDALTIDLDYYHFDVENEVNAVYRIESSNGDTNCGSRAGLYCGALPTTPIPGPSNLPGYVQDPRSSGINASTDVYRAAAELNLTDTLSVAYLFGKIKGDVFAAGGSDKDPTTANGGAYNIFSFGPEGNYNYESHEARLQYEGTNGLYAMIGGFAHDGTDFDLFSFGFVPFLGTTPITSSDGALVNSPTLTHTKTRAVFGRIAMPLMDDRLNVTAEGRYTDQKKDVSAGATTYDYSETNFTPRFAIDYKITPNNMVYASVAKGVKSGGVNTSTFAGLIPAERFYGPDTNWTYEIGTKNTFAGGRGFINFDVFYIDWSSLQVPQTPTGAPINTATVTVNLGGAKSKGVELSAAYEVVENFTVDAGLAYIDATFNSGTISGRLARAGICDDVVCAANGDISGNTLQRSSPWQWNIGAAYDGPLTDTLGVFGRVDVFGQSKQYTDESNTGIIQARTLANASAGVKGDHWKFSIWAKNLFDKTYVANAFFTATPFGTSYVPSIGNRRRIGATISVDF